MEVLLEGHIGQCKQKVSQDITITLFVGTNNQDPNADGSYDKPFRYIVNVLRYANQEAAPYNFATIKIYLLNMEHIMSRITEFHEFIPTAKDTASIQKSITIEPVFCGATIGGHTFAPADTD